MDALFGLACFALLLYFLVINPIKERNERKRHEKEKLVIDLKTKYRRGYDFFKQKYPSWNEDDFCRNYNEIIAKHKELSSEKQKKQDVDDMLAQYIRLMSQDIFKKRLLKSEIPHQEEIKKPVKVEIKETKLKTKRPHEDEIKKILRDNNITEFYHFTSRKNIPSIRQQGGLFSWHYLKEHNIDIPLQGGGDLSQELDKWYGNADYVHLSFCLNHPMAYRLKNAGEDIVLLKISPDVALLEGTKFSNMNAVDSKCESAEGIDGLKLVNFEATKIFYMKSDDPLFKYKQAEILVKRHIPLKYILNIDII